MAGRDRGGERRPRLDRMAGLVLAMVAGTMVPAVVIAAAGSKQPVPRECQRGQGTPTSVEGALLYTHGADLWYTEGYPGHPRKLVDYTPSPPRPPRATPAPSSAPAADRSTPAPSAAASAGNTPSPSPSPVPPQAEVIAADISASRQQVAYLVQDLPGSLGQVHLFVMSPLDPPGTGPVEAWSGDVDRALSASAQVHELDNGKLIAYVPVRPAPGAAATAPPSPSPSRSPTTGPSPSASPAALGLADLGTVIVDPAGKPPTLIDSEGARGFFAIAHPGASETGEVVLPKLQPATDARADGPSGRVAGRRDLDLSTPLIRRRVNEIVLGRAGHPELASLCVAGAGTRPVGFSPDEADLVLWDGSRTLVMALRDTHGATPLMAAHLLTWRA